LHDLLLVRFRCGDCVRVHLELDPAFADLSVWSEVALTCSQEWSDRPARHARYRAQRLRSPQCRGTALFDPIREAGAIKEDMEARRARCNQRHELHVAQWAASGIDEFAKHTDDHFAQLKPPARNFGIVDVVQIEGRHHAVADLGAKPDHATCTVGTRHKVVLHMRRIRANSDDEVPIEESSDELYATDFCIDQLPNASTSCSASHERMA